MPTLSRRISRPTHKTTAGRVVYDRPKHRMSLKDALRIMRNVNLSYESEESIEFFALEVLEYEVRLLAAIVWWYPYHVPNYMDLFFRFEALLEQFWSIAFGMGTSLYERFKILMRSFGGR